MKGSIVVNLVPHCAVGRLVPFAGCCKEVGSTMDCVENGITDSWQLAQSLVTREMAVTTLLCTEN